MLGLIAVVLLVLWIVGVLSSYTLGGLIHILPVLAVVLFMIRVFLLAIPKIHQD